MIVITLVFYIKTSDSRILLYGVYNGFIYKKMSASKTYFASSIIQNKCFRKSSIHLEFCWIIYNLIIAIFFSYGTQSLFVRLRVVEYVIVKVS